MNALMKPENRGKTLLALGGVASGIGVLALVSFVSGHFITALIFGGLIFFGGWSLFKKPKSALAGMFGLGAGVLVALAGIPIIGGLSSTMLFLSGIGLIAAGVLTLVQTARSK